MALLDAVTGALQTPEQRAAVVAQHEAGLLARIEGRFLSFQEQLAQHGKAVAAEQARVDALEQKAKATETVAVGKVAEHLAQREGNLVIVTGEMRADLDRLRADVTALVAQLNGLSPNFFLLTPPPPSTPVAGVPVVIEKVDPLPPHPMPTSREKRDQARKDAEEGGA